MTATFAGISWRSQISDAVILLRSKGLTVSQKDSKTLTAKGKIFGKNSNIFMNFDILGLYEVNVFIDIEIGRAWDEYKMVKSVLLEKYGSPLYDEVDSSV